MSTSTLELPDVSLAPGFRLPFFPMRPKLSFRLRSEADVAATLETNDRAYDISLKLNGDRACLAVLDGTVAVQSRHGTPYKLPIANRELFKDLAGAWLLDGEVYKKQFLPFEVIVAGGKSMADECPSIRKAAAYEITRRLHMPWVYGYSQSHMYGVGKQALVEPGVPVYEGFVLKRKGSRYVPVGSATKESETWLKTKWAA